MCRFTDSIVFLNDGLSYIYVHSVCERGECVVSRSHLWHQELKRHRQGYRQSEFSEPCNCRIACRSLLSTRREDGRTATLHEGGREDGRTATLHEVGRRMEGLQHCMKEVHVHVPYGWFISQSSFSRIVGLGCFAGKIFLHCTLFA